MLVYREKKECGLENEKGALYSFSQSFVVDGYQSFQKCNVTYLIVRIFSSEVHDRQV